MGILSELLTKSPKPPEEPDRKEIEAVLNGPQVELPEPAEIRQYLDLHPDLAEILPAVCAQARKEFGTEAELLLRLYRDPEVDDCHLSLYVRLPAYDNTTMSRLDQVTQPFDEELCRASGYLLVTCDFLPPRANHGV